VKYNTVVLLFSEKTPAWTIKKIQKQQVKYLLLNFFNVFIELTQDFFIHIHVLNNKQLQLPRYF